MRACALDYGSSWDDNFPYAEFSYNNSYQASLKMAPFEALYGRRCRTPLMWDEVGDRQLFGPDLIKESKEKVKLIQDRLKIAQSRQKSYADSKCKEVVYEIRDRVYLRVSPLRGVKHFGVKGKLAPRFVGPYRVGMDGRSCLQAGIARRIVRSSRCVPRFPAEEVPRKDG